MRRDEYLSILEMKRDIKKQSWKKEGSLPPEKIEAILNFIDKTFKDYTGEKGNGKS
jgi:hypothetical protein